MITNGPEPVLAVARNRFGRAVERFNQCGLRLTRPGPNWLLTSLRLGLIVAIASLTAAFLVAASYHVLGHKWPGQAQDRGGAEFVFSAVIFAPLTETAFILLIHLLTRWWLGIVGFVLVNTVLSAAAHIPTQVVPISATMLFLVMSYQYVSFRNDVGRWRAFAGVATCHAVNNAVALSFGLVAGLLGS